MGAGLRERANSFAWFAVVAVGLSCAGVWTNVMGASAKLFPNIAEAAFVASAFNMGRLAVGVALIPFALIIQRHWRSVSGAAALAIVSATGFAILAPYQTLLDPSALCGACLLVGSACYTLLTTSFYSKRH